MIDIEPIIHIFEGEFECPKCGRRFPTHYKVKKDFWDRRQFGRRWVCSYPNVCRHIKACVDLRELNNKT